MAFATQDEVEAALGRELADSELLRVDHLLATASDPVDSYLNWERPDPVPDPVVRVVADMVAGVFSRPAPTVAAWGAGGYNQSREAATVHVGAETVTTTGPWNTKPYKERLKPFRVAVQSVRLISDRDPDPLDEDDDA